MLMSYIANIYAAKNLAIGDFKSCPNSPLWPCHAVFLLRFGFGSGGSSPPSSLSEASSSTDFLALGLLLALDLALDLAAGSFGAGSAGGFSTFWAFRIVLSVEKVWGKVYIYIIQKTWNWQPFIAGIFLENKMLIRTRLAELDILHHGPRRPWQYGIYILCIYYLWSFHALQIFLHSSLGILRVQLGFNLLGDCLQSFDFPKPAVKNQNN